MKDGTYTVRLDAEGIPMLTSQINMTDGEEARNILERLRKE